MSLFHGAHERLRDHFLRSAAQRLRGGGADWAAAMSAEAQACPDEAQRLRWAFGCWRASFSAPGALDGLTYALALGLGVTLVTTHQWLADEGMATLALLGGVSLVLGLLRPGRTWTSGGVIGLVVSAVLVFEVLSGVRPAYEHVQSFTECLRWLIFAPPALVAAAVGGWLRRRLDPEAATR